MKRFLEFLSEARTSQAAQQAKKLGLAGDGHGYWIDKQGSRQAKTVKGKLEFIQQKKKKSEGVDDSKRQQPADVKSKKLAKATPAKKRLGAKPKVTTTQKPKSKTVSGSKSSTGQQPKQDSRGNVVTIAFGKFNPPTKAHKNLLNALKQSASGGNFYVFPSRTQDKKQNPLSPDSKVEYMKEMFPEYVDRIIDSDEFKTIFDVLVFLNQEGYTAVNIVCGAERVSEIDNLAKKQNGQTYQYQSINVMSSGPKDLDGEGSTSDEARKAAAAGDFESFKKAMPPAFKSAKKLFDELGGSVKEGVELWEIAPSLDWKGLRENYIFGNLFKVGSIVESVHTGLRGEVIRSGANHLICVTKEGIMFKSWIKDVFEVHEIGTDEYRQYLQSITPGQPIEKYSKDKTQINKKRNTISKVK
jgi:hypothetical protein